MSDNNKNASPYDEEGYPLGSKHDDPLTDLILTMSGEKARLQEQAFRNKVDYTEEMRTALKYSKHQLPTNNFTVMRHVRDFDRLPTYYLELRYRIGEVRYAFQAEIESRLCSRQELFNANLSYALMILLNIALRYHANEGR